MFFVVNPKSANGKTEKRWEEEIVPILKSDNIEYKLQFTEYQNHATEIVREKIKNGESFIVIVGGDGTFNEAANGFFENGQSINPDCVLGFISSGTGSDVIKTLGHSKDFAEQIEILKTGIVKKIDVGIAKYVDFDGNDATRLFFNVGDVGLGGDVVDRVNRTTKRLGGKMSFLVGAIRGIIHHKAINSTIIVDDDEANKVEGPLNLMAVGNFKYFGGGMKVCPEAIYDDGLFDVVSAHGMGRFKLLRSIGKLYSGEHIKMETVTVHPRAKKVKVSSESPAFLDLDGEQVGTTPVEFTIIPKALSIKTIECIENSEE